MRSEKVYRMTQLIQAKLDQLAGEKEFIQQRYEEFDGENDQMKESINAEHEELRNNLEEAER